MTDGDGGSRLEIRRVLSAEPERVWSAWTEASSMSRWMCPGGVERAEVELDVREGGAFTIDMIEGEVVHHHTGRYIEVRRPERLAFTWVSPATKKEESVVTVELREVAEGTELTLVHERLPDDEAAEQHRGGWGSILEKLEGALNG